MGSEDGAAYYRLEKAETKAKKLRGMMYRAEQEARDIKEAIEFGKDGPTLELRTAFHSKEYPIFAGIRMKYEKKCLVFFIPADGVAGGYSPNIALPLEQAEALARFILDNPPATNTGAPQ